MKFLFFALLTQIVTSVPFLSHILGLGGIAEVDLSGLSVLSPSSDTTKVNINKGYGNYVGPQYSPASVYGGYNGYGAQQWFNPGFQGGPSTQGFTQEKGNQLSGQYN
jgi:hypothetical protein